WPTAASRDHKGKPKGTHRSDGKPHTDDQLDRAAESFPCSLPDAPTTDAGLNSLLEVWTRPSCPRLSAAFQWWLQGWLPPRAFLAWAETEACHGAQPGRPCICGRASWDRWRRQNVVAVCLTAEGLSRKGARP